MDDIQLQILNEIKELAVNHASLAQKLDSVLEDKKKLDEQLSHIHIEVKKVPKHDLIIKSMLWVYGLIFSAVAYGFFSKK